MTLSTIKKATAIYRLTGSLLFIFFLIISQTSMGQDEDLSSFCFPPTTNLKMAENDLGSILLPKEKILPRPQDHCFDVITSPHRGKLLEKFLRKRYSLIGEVGMAKASDGISEHCRIEFKTLRKKSAEARNVILSSRPGANTTSVEEKDISTMELLLGLGKSGVLDLEGKSLNVVCTKGATGVYQLVFSYGEVGKSKVSSSVSLKQNEVLQVAQVIKDLNEKNKVLGLPETSFQDTTGKETTDYELQIK